jgi:hypothetical protein
MNSYKISVSCLKANVYHLTIWLSELFDVVIWGLPLSGEAVFLEFVFDGAADRKILMLLHNRSNYKDKQ